MADPKWLRPQKQLGIKELSKPVTMKFTLPETQALREYAAQESLRTGTKIAQSTIVRTLLHRDGNFRRLLRATEAT